MGGSNQNSPSFHEITLKTDPATGIVIYEAWWKDSNLDRSDGAAVTVRDAATGKVTREEWWKDGNLHRAGGPAVTWRDAATGIIAREEWWKDGNHARADGPAVILRDPRTSTVTREEWCKDGNLHRDERPALTTRDAATGIITCEAWWRDGNLDRADGPAVIARDSETGKVASETWYKEGTRIAPPVSQSDYWQESIEILLQVMENNRDDLVVILAGHADKMDRFFHSNPGFRSRVAHHIDFPDYTDADLMAIGARPNIPLRRAQQLFANARSIRNALDRVRLRHANRLFTAGDPAIVLERLTTIEESDIRASRVFALPPGT